MNLLVGLIIFILFWWALLATIFSFQLHQENEDYARRLGERRELQKIFKPKYAAIEILNSPRLVKLRSLKFYLNRLSLEKIWRLIPLKINIK